MGPCVPSPPHTGSPCHTRNLPDLSGTRSGGVNNTGVQRWVVGGPQRRTHLSSRVGPWSTMPVRPGRPSSTDRTVSSRRSELSVVSGGGARDWASETGDTLSPCPSLVSRPSPTLLTPRTNLDRVWSRCVRLPDSVPGVRGRRPLHWSRPKKGEPVPKG